MHLLLASLRAWRSGLDPLASGRDEFRVRERRQRPHTAVDSAAGLECPEYERLFGVMLQQSGAVPIVVLRSIRDRTADFCARQDLVVQILPLHRQRRQVPVMRAGQAGAVRVGVLMASNTLQRRNPFALWPAHHVREMPVPVIALLRVVRGRMAVDAPRMREHGINLLPCCKPVRSRRGHLRGIVCTARECHEGKEKSYFAVTHSAKFPCGS